MNQIKRRLASIEHDQAQAAIDEATEYNRMFRQCQAEFGLPLPECTPDNVTEEALKRAIALQAALRERPDDHSPAHRFREWVKSVHEKYGASK